MSVFTFNSCALFLDKANVDKDIDSKIKIQHWNIGSDSLNVYLNSSFPVNNFVFKKKEDFFTSNLVFTIVVSDVNSLAQIYRETWEDKIVENLFEDHRSSDNYYKIEKSYRLLPGEYKFFINIQDKNNQENWKYFKEIKLDRIKHISSPMLFTNKKNAYHLVRDIDQEIDTLWVRTQVNIVDESNNILKYYLNREEEIIDSGKINLPMSEIGIENLYYFPLLINQYKNGEYNLKITFSDESKNVSFRYNIMNSNYWTDNINEVMQVMNYFLSKSESRRINKMTESDKWEEINLFWMGLDPDSTTQKNELLNELNVRVKYSIKNFSVLGPGWRSDRGRIYITYGAPQFIDVSFDENLRYNFQKWKYKNGKEYIFIDRTLSGDYSLYNESY